MFIFNQQIKKELIICMTVARVTLRKCCFLDQWLKAYKYMSAKALLALQQMSSFLLLFQSRLIHIYFSHVTKDASESFPCGWLGLAILPLGLPRSCCRSKVQTQAHVNHTDTHRKLRQHSNREAINTNTYFPSSHILMGEFKSACCTRITLSGTHTVYFNFKWYANLVLR